MSEEVEPALVKAKAILRHLGLQAKKSLGQHFLVDRRVLGRIISAAELTSDDMVIEVGPGLGVLTLELAKRARRVVAVEADAAMVSALGAMVHQYPNLTVVHADILEKDPGELLASIEEDRSLGSYKVVANIPYHITSAVLRHFLEASHRPVVMVVMVQKEVGEAIVAGPGNMSLLAVSVQFYGKPSIVARVPARSFYPPPRVDSVILRVDVYPQPLVDVPSKSAFFNLVRAGFSAPRKQLRNSLALGLGIPVREVTDLLEKAGIDPRRRAESLSLQEWGRLCLARGYYES